MHKFLYSGVRHWASGQGKKSRRKASPHHAGFHILTQYVKVFKKQTFEECTVMKNRQELGLAVLLALGLVFIILINASLPSKAENRELTKAVFHVAWFDVSEEVLDGLKGVERVYSHFLGSHEANTVWFDPALIDIEQMEDALKDRGGYLGTVN